MNQHTPGPWHVEEPIPTDEGTPILVVEGGADIVIAEVSTDMVSQMQAEADARLIAAAPAMLAALKRVIPVLRQWSNCRDFVPTDPDDDYCQELFEATAAVDSAEGLDR